MTSRSVVLNAPIGLDQFEQLAVHLFGIGGQRHVKRRGVALDARPVAVPGEEHAIGDPQGGEDAPSGEQAHLRGRERRSSVESRIWSLWRIWR